MSKYIVILSDSRGKGFKNFLRLHKRELREKNLSIVVEIYPGKTIENLAVHVQRLWDRRPPDLCVIFAGICSLTEKECINGQHRISYPSDRRDEKVDSVKRTISHLQSRYEGNINICHIVPACLRKYIEKHNPRINKSDLLFPNTIEEEQAALIADIKSINELIQARNAEVGNTNINLFNRFTANTLRRYRSGDRSRKRKSSKLVSTKLADGLHFDKEAKFECFSLILKTIIRDTEERSVQDSQSEEDDFVPKRARIDIEVHPVNPAHQEEQPTPSTSGIRTVQIAEEEASPDTSIESINIESIFDTSQESISEWDYKRHKSTDKN